MFLGLHKRPTYNEVIETLNTNKDLIVKPNREATQFARTAEYLNLVSESFRDIEQTQINEMKRKQMEELVRQQTMSNGTDFHQHNTHNRRPGPPPDPPTTQGPEEHNISTPRGGGGQPSAGARLFESAHQQPTNTDAAHRASYTQWHAGNLPAGAVGATPYDDTNSQWSGYGQRLGDPITPHTSKKSRRGEESQPTLTAESIAQGKKMVKEANKQLKEAEKERIRVKKENMKAERDDKVRNKADKEKAKRERKKENKKSKGSQDIPIDDEDMEEEQKRLKRDAENTPGNPKRKARRIRKNTGEAPPQQASSSSAAPAPVATEPPKPKPKAKGRPTKKT